MKILFSGYHNPNFLTVTEYIENAFKSRGCEIFFFDNRRFLVPDIIRKKISYLNKLDFLKTYGTQHN